MYCPLLQAHRPGARRLGLHHLPLCDAGRLAEELEDQPIAVAQRALQPLARLTRTLGEMDKHTRPPLPPHEYEIDTPKPRRSLSELRDELVAHLERIEREEGRHWDIREWWFSETGGFRASRRRL